MELTEATLRRTAAYHEAGHAAIIWMFGNLSDLQCIDMRGKAGMHAYIRSRGWAWPACSASGMPPEIMNFGTKRQMIRLLAGYASEARIGALAADAWLNDVLTDGEWEWYEDHDISRALEAAKALRGDNGNAWRLLHRMGKWTDEALSHPRLWGVVEALAERLTTIKTRMTGSSICRVMEQAWGDGTLPYMEMGPQWRRRFAVKA